MEQPLVELSQDERLPVPWWPQAAALLLIVLDLGWVVPWQQAIAGLGNPQPAWKAWPVLGAVMALAYVLSLMLERLRLVRKAALVILSGALAAALAGVTLILYPVSPVRSAAGQFMLVDPGFLAAILLTLLLWQRGVGLGVEVVSPDLAWRRFRSGLAALMLHQFVTSIWGLPRVGFAGLTVYLFVGLLAVSLARISYVSLTRSARKNPFDRRWILTTGGVLGGAVLLSALASGLLTGQYRDLLDSARAILGYISVVVLFIASLPGVMISYLVLVPLLERLLAGFEYFQEPGEVLGGAYPLDLGEQQAMTRLPLAVQTACFWITLAMIVLLVFLRVRQRMKKPRLMPAEGPESLLSQGDTARLARQAMQGFFDGLAHRLRPQAREQAAERVRQIYAQLLDLSAALDHPRPESSTPFEYLPILENAFPHSSADLHAITASYVKVRYGEYPENVDEVRALEAAWVRLQAEGERLKKIKRALPTEGVQE